MNVTLAGSASPSISLPSPAWTGTAYDSFDDPLSGKLLDISCFDLLLNFQVILRISFDSRVTYS